MQLLGSLTTNMFSGSKGSRPASSPVRTPDSLRSKDKVEVILGLCEGEIVGLKDGDRSFRIGGTPLQNADGTYNFTKFELNVFPGAAVPAPVVPRLGGLSRSTAVNVNLYTGTAVTRETGGEVCDALELRLVVDRLLRVDDHGSYAAELQVKIEVKPASAGQWATWSDGRALVERLPPPEPGAPAHTAAAWTAALAAGRAGLPAAPDGVLTLSGKTESTYVKELRIPVPRLDEPYQVRVTKLSPESTTTYYAEVTWESLQEVRAGPWRWPDTAVVQLVGEASDQFSSVPEFAGIYRGMICRVPNNYDPETGVTTGLWDGGFVRRWTCNPAWILHEIVTNDRWGWAAFKPGLHLDKWDVDEAARWCDQLVPDGRGGYQRRYTFHAYLTDALPGREFAQYVAGAFNAAIWDDLNGTVHLVVDQDAPAVALFTPENVTEEGFQYTYTDLTSRYNDITVVFRNKDLDYAEDRRRVADEAHIARFGRIPLDVVAVGCTDGHEAQRRGQYKLITGLTETQMVTFTTNRLGQFVQPWEIILIADPTLGHALTGRLQGLEAGRTRLRLRDPLYLETGVAYRIRLQLPGAIVTRAVTNAVRGTVYALDLDAALPDDVPEQTVFAVEDDGGAAGLPKPYRVLGIEEVDGNPDLQQIQAIEVNRNKWADADGLTHRPPIVYERRSPDRAEPPVNLRILETTATDHLGAHLTLVLLWDRSPSPFVRRYVVAYRRNGGPTHLLTHTSEERAEFRDVPAGSYEFEVVAQTLTGRSSAPLTGRYDLRTRARIVAPVANLRLLGEPSATEFARRSPTVVWDVPSPDPFLSHYEVEVRHPLSGALRRTARTTETRFQYLYDQNVADGLARSVRLRVTVVDRFANRSAPVALTIANPKAAPLRNLRVDGAFGGVSILFDRPSEPDWAGVKIWASPTAGVTPSAATLVYDGPNTWHRHEGAGTWYFRLASYDTFSAEDYDLSGEYAATAAVVEDFDPPATPAGLTLTSRVTIEPGGMPVTRLAASWTRAGEADFSFYEVQIREGTGSWVSDTVANVDPDGDGRVVKEWIVRANTAYSVRLRGVDSSANRGPWTATASLTTGGDTGAPGPVTGLTATAALRTVLLEWVNPSDADLDGAEVWEATSNTRAAATRLDRVRGNAYVRTGLAPAVTRYYWVRAVDTSGNAGPWFPASPTAGVAATTIRAGTTDISDHAIRTHHVAAGTIVGDHVAAGAITGSHIAANAVLAQTITVGGTGVSLAAIADPATRINAATTLIDPGRIALYGATTLASWRYGGDWTEIDGGRIAANTITANQVEVGSRNIIFEGVEFAFNKTTHVLSWTAGTIAYTNDAGTRTSVGIASGGATWSAGTLYVYWIKDEALLRSTTARATALGADRLVLATYRGGYKLITTYARTLIDGDEIVTRTLRADRLLAGSITATELSANAVEAGHITSGAVESRHLRTDTAVITGSAQVGAGIVLDGHIGSVSAAKLTADSVIGTRIFVGTAATDRVMLDGVNKRLLFRDPAGRNRVLLGNCSGDGRWGLVLYAEDGTVILDSRSGSSILDGTYIKDLTVDTLQIKNGAVTAANGAVHAGHAPTAAGWVNLASVTVTTSGNPVFVMSEGRFYSGASWGGSSFNGGTTYIRLLRNGLDITGSQVGSSAPGVGEWEAASLNHRDTPGAGVVTYTLQYQPQAIFGTGSWGQAGRNSIFVMELKR